MNKEIERLKKQSIKLGRKIRFIFIIIVFMFGFALGFIGFVFAPNLFERDVNMLVQEYNQETFNWGNYTFPEEDRHSYLLVRWSNLDPSKSYLMQQILLDEDFDAWVLTTVYPITGKTNHSATIKIEKSHFLLTYHNTTTGGFTPVVSVALYEEIHTIDIIKALPELGGFDLLSIFMGIGVGLVLDLLFIMFGYSLKSKIKERIRLVRKTTDNS